MPVETSYICHECSSRKAQANGWYLITRTQDCISIEPAPKSVPREMPLSTEVACGRECGLKMVSRGMGELKHG